MTIEEIIITFSYVGILFLMSINGIVSVPSSQIIYIIAGYFVFVGNLNPLIVILVGALGHTIGNYILYEISRRKGLEYSTKFIKFMFPMHDVNLEIKKFQVAFEKRSKLLLFVGKLANPSKIFIPIPAGIIKMHRGIFLIITYVTSCIWASIFIAIGYFFGKSYKNFGWIGIILLLVFVIVMYYFYKSMNSKEVLKEVKKRK